MERKGAGEPSRAGNGSLNMSRIVEQIDSLTTIYGVILYISGFCSAALFIFIVGGIDEIGATVAGLVGSIMFFVWLFGYEKCYESFKSELTKEALL
ncbi:MAG TPA: hypothetical protein ENI53_01530 [Thermoplasmatales archaeon]|nr:hypothetical protein [Thermoplasmatales archaeon]